MEANEFIRTIRESGTSLSINIPPETIKLMKLKKGDLVNVKLEKVQGENKAA